jgi:hypothetical protein
MKSPHPTKAQTNAHLQHYWRQYQQTQSSQWQEETLKIMHGYIRKTVQEHQSLLQRYSHETEDGISMAQAEIIRIMQKGKVRNTKTLVDYYLKATRTTLLSLTRTKNAKVKDHRNHEDIQNHQNLKSPNPQSLEERLTSQCLQDHPEKLPQLQALLTTPTPKTLRKTQDPTLLQWLKQTLTPHKPQQIQAF